MSDFTNNAFFWQKVDTIFFSNRFIITKNKNDRHDVYPNLIYPVEYGYLEDTCKPGNEISVYKGTKGSAIVDTLVVTADILNKDIEIKLLVGCTEEEEQQILHFLNQTDFQKSVLIRRGDEIPSWALTD